MKNLKEGFVGIVLIVVIVLAAVGGGIYLHTEKPVNNILLESRVVETTKTEANVSEPKIVKTENKVEASVKSVWGNCVSGVNEKLLFNFDQMKARFGGGIYMDRFYVKFNERAQIELKDGKLVSKCGADVESVNQLLIKNALTIEYVDSSKIDFQVLISANSDIDKQKSVIEKIYNMEITEYVSLVPMSSNAGMR